MLSWLLHTAGHERANSSAIRHARSPHAGESPIVSASRYCGGPPSHWAAASTSAGGIEARPSVPSATPTTSVASGPTSMIQLCPEGPCSASNWFNSHATCSGGTWVFEKTLTVVGTVRPYAAVVRDRSLRGGSGGQSATHRCPPAQL